ncbi:isopentenyl-diphosphate delta-isomerase [Bacillus methanolicus PB1]|uniref:Isopentenyl-diphosphate delta-isomerase n=1 Tax=Bacillus methanolicus PB1 TaxID=997296 RepID=I3DWS7_BACMT|nr:isopentenyl-diphosphate delta-isomerase [Bacillus methanolicus PB1]
MTILPRKYPASFGGQIKYHQNRKAASDLFLVRILYDPISFLVLTS